MVGYLGSTTKAGITDPPPAVTFGRVTLLRPHETAVDGVAVENEGIAIDQPLGDVKAAFGQQRREIFVGDGRHAWTIER